MNDLASLMSQNISSLLAGQIDNGDLRIEVATIPDSLQSNGFAGLQSLIFHRGRGRHSENTRSRVRIEFPIGEHR